MSYRTFRSSGYGYECPTQLTEVLCRVIPVPRVWFVRTLQNTTLKYYSTVTIDRAMYKDYLIVGNHRIFLSFRFHLHTIGDNPRQTCACVCSSHETDPFTHLHPAQPVYVPMPLRETSSVVTNCETETR